MFERNYLEINKGLEEYCDPLLKRMKYIPGGYTEVSMLNVLPMAGTLTSLLP
jgi:hypothetical protein